MKAKKIIPYLLLSTSLLLGACSNENKTQTTTSTSTSTTNSSTKTTSSETTSPLTLKKENNLYGAYQEEDYLDAENKVDTTVTFKETTAKITGSGASLSGNTLKITKGGNYLLKGSFSGSVEIKTEEQVHFILNNVTLTNETAPALNIVESKKVIVTLAKGSTNVIADGNKETTEEDANSAIYSKADLTFNGSGKLKVTGKTNNAIQSKDDLTFISGTYEISAVNNALKGKDKVAILDGNFILKTENGDAIQASNTDKTDKGFIAIDGGDFTITSGSDGIQGASAVYVQKAKMKLTTSGSDNEASYKGLKAGNNLVVDSGTFTFTTQDDALHSNGDLTINGGEFTLSSKDDGMHSDDNLTINGGKINILESYEGLESANIVLNGGDIVVNASDDGVNASSSSQASSTGENEQASMTPPEGENGSMTPPEEGQTPPELPAGENGKETDIGKTGTSENSQDSENNTQRQKPSGMPPANGNGGFGGEMTSGDGSTLVINGGTLTVNANGDGLDSNGDITMTGGVVKVFGPTSNGDGALDYDGSFNLTGGTLLGVGSSGMAQTVSKESSQVNLAFYLNASTTAKTVTLTQNGKTLITFTPHKAFQQIVFSSPELTTGEVTITVDEKTYTLTLADTYNSLAEDGSTYAGGGMGGPQRGGENPRQATTANQTKESTL